MENVGPGFLVVIGLLLAAVIAACVLWDFRLEIWSFVAALVRRFVRARSYDDLLSSVTDRGRVNNDLADSKKSALSPVKRNGETSESTVATGKNQGSDPFQFPDGFTMLARLVLAEKLGETDALKLAVKASPGKGPRYTEARARLHAALEHERPPSGPRFVEYDDEGRPKLDANGQIVTTGRQSTA